jgi:uncharacterized protein YgbK (DUF1537 family)
MVLNNTHIIQSLPSCNEDCFKESIRAELIAQNRIIVVLDDDPTGTQTMHNIPVLTNWDKSAIEDEIKRETRLFYILTNSRSMIASEADSIHRLIGRNIALVFKKFKRDYIVISRGDSTLRGHYPNDIMALAEGLQLDSFHTALIPAFFEGGRFTIKDVHYVRDGEHLIPVAETPFAKDRVFGFLHSNLKEWIAEKTGGVVKASAVVSFSLDELRNESVVAIAEKIKKLSPITTCIVNAVAYCDVEKFAIAYLQSGVQMLFRTAASFVKAISVIEEKNFLTAKELVKEGNQNGGLIIIGSYVPKTTSQLQALLLDETITAFELNVNDILERELKVNDVVEKMEHLINVGNHVVMYTSRLLHTGNSESENLRIGNQVSGFITAVVAALKIVPRFMIAKGGITSSDIATKALGMKRAMVAGQALSGVPVWMAGEESKFPGLPFIIFPGNVGSDNALVELYRKIINIH